MKTKVKFFDPMVGGVYKSWESRANKFAEDNDLRIISFQLYMKNAGISGDVHREDICAYVLFEGIKI